jgi:hypothetical protein
MLEGQSILFFPLQQEQSYKSYQPIELCSRGSATELCSRGSPSIKTYARGAVEMNRMAYARGAVHSILSFATSTITQVLSAHRVMLEGQSKRVMLEGQSILFFPLQQAQSHKSYQPIELCSRGSPSIMAYARGAVQMNHFIQTSLKSKPVFLFVINSIPRTL